MRVCERVRVHVGTCMHACAHVHESMCAWFVCVFVRHLFVCIYTRVHKRRNTHTECRNTHSHIMSLSHPSILCQECEFLLRVANVLLCHSLTHLPSVPRVRIIFPSARDNTCTPAPIRSKLFLEFPKRYTTQIFLPHICRNGTVTANRASNSDVQISEYGASTPALYD